MNKLPMYHVMIRILNCPILWIAVPSYGFLTRNKMAAVNVQWNMTGNGHIELFKVTRYNF